MNISLAQMRYLDAIASQGSFHAAARLLNKSHPNLVLSMKKLEEALGFAVFDRSGYRTGLSAKGQVYLKHVRSVLSEAEKCQAVARELQKDQETELRLVIGDITPIAPVLSLVKTFKKTHDFSRLHLLFENLYGPVERLLEGQADMIVHHLPAPDIRFETKAFCQIDIVPVIAPELLGKTSPYSLRYEDLKPFPQCVIRDTAQHPKSPDYFVLPEHTHIYVGDQATKREVIRQGLAWGHMPDFLVRKDIEQGRLINLTGPHIPAHNIPIKIIRLRDSYKGPLARSLWNALSAAK